MDEEKENQEKTESAIPPLRTYRSDVAESMRGGKQSLARMVMAERARKDVRGEGVPEEDAGGGIFSKRNIFLAAGVVLFLVAFGIIGLLLIGKNAQREGVLPPTPIWSPIFTEREERVILQNTTESAIKNEVARIQRGTAIPINSVLQIAFVKPTQTAEGFVQEIPVSANELFSAIPNSMPPQLLRTLDDSFFFGLHSFRTIAPALIMQNRFYDGAFLGMLEWERFMFFDLAPLFSLGASGGTRSFEDVVINNIDVRAQRNASGDIILLYAFVDRETIVITTNTAAFEEIVRRLRTPRPIIQ